MNKKDLEHFKKKLLGEKAALEEELAHVGQHSSNKPNGWEATSKDMDIDAADENEVADKLEELEENAGIVTQLQKQLTEVLAALERIEKGTYGVCENTNKPIEKARLEANPAARTSVAEASKPK